MLRRDDHLRGLACGNLLIKFERAQEEAVGHVFAVQTKLYGLTLLENDLGGAEGEALRRDLNDGQVICSYPTGAAEQNAQAHAEDGCEHTKTHFHR